MKYALIWISLLLFVNTTVFPQHDSLEFSLDEAMQYALSNNLNAQNARLDLQSAEKRVWEAAAGGLPQLSGSAVYNNNLSLATTLIPDFFGDPTQKIEIQFGTKHYATAGLSASQLVFSGQYIVGLRAAKLFKEFTLNNLRLSDQQIKEAVIQSYYLVLLAENMHMALKGNLENMQRTFDETTAMVEAGLMDAMDADQLELSLTDIENAVLSMERQYEAAKVLLKYQMGLSLDADISLTDKLAEKVQEIDFNSLADKEMDIQSNINYQILEDQEKLALMDMKMKQTEYMPNLSAFLSLDVSAQRDAFNFFESGNNWYTASAAGLSLNLPIFSSGMRMAGVAQKRIAYEQARNNKEFVAEGLRVEYLQAQFDFRTASEKLQRERKNLELSKKVIEVTEERYKEGLASSLELSQVNDQYLQTLSSLTAAMVDLLNARISLDILLNKL